MALRAQTRRIEAKAANLQVYRDPEVVSHYASLQYLTACERLLFETYLAPGMAILDVGVGGGRTTSYLSRQAARYVGVDYSEEMIRRCRDKFPRHEFVLADASDLSEFADQSFDAVVFAFNGLDYISPAEKRRQCLQEFRRVLKSGGWLIFSSHNPRSLWQRPGWDREVVRTLARRLAPHHGSRFTAALCALTIAKAAHAFVRALAGLAMRIVRRVPTAAFWRGHGYLVDSAHGGLITHYSIPRYAIAEASRIGFRFESLRGDDYPRRSREWITDWYYYVFAKNGEACV